MAWHWDIDDLYARYCRYLLLLNSFSSISNNISDIYFKKRIPRWCKILFTSHGLTLNQELLIAYLSIGLLVLNSFLLQGVTLNSICIVPTYICLSMHFLTTFTCAFLIIHDTQFLMVKHKWFQLFFLHPPSLGSVMYRVY